MQGFPELGMANFLLIFAKNTLFLAGLEYLPPSPQWKFVQDLGLWVLSSHEYPSSLPGKWKKGPELGILSFE